MNPILFKAIVAFLPAGMLLAGSLVIFFRSKTMVSFLQCFGAASLVLVVISHAFEALQIFPWMRWGMEHSPGHDLDLASSVMGLTLFPVGYLFHALATRK